MNKIEILEYLKELKPSLENDGIVSLGLFGSYANDKFQNDSDIDILIETSDKFITKYRGWSAFTRLEEIKKQISKKLQKDVDIFDKSSPNSQIRDTILKEVIYV